MRPSNMDEQARGYGSFSPLHDQCTAPFTAAPVKHSRLTSKSHYPIETRMIRVSAAQYFWFGYATSPAEEGTRVI
jgi:hypothetical protein